MTRTRRAAALLVAAATLLVGPALPADATFADTAAAPGTTVGTVDVAAPGSFSAQGSRCSKAAPTAVRLQPVLSWKPSTTPGVTGYQISAFLSDGRRIWLGRTDASASTFRTDYVNWSPSAEVRFAVAAQTSYGWTEESPRSGAFPC